MTAATLTKGRRLASEGRVHEATTARVFEVAGDHGTYHVVADLRDGVLVTTCTCLAEGTCSHIAAVAVEASC